AIWNVRLSDSCAQASLNVETILAPRLCEEASQPDWSEPMSQMGKRSRDLETERVRRIWEKLAPRYDNDIKIFERLLFSGGRKWVTSQAKGEVLEIGVGTGRNLDDYPP